MGLDVMPEAVATQQGINKGWRAYMNAYTRRGKAGLFFGSLLGTYSIVQLFKVKGKLKQRSVQKAEDQKKWNKMMEEVRQWEKNGKKFV